MTTGAPWEAWAPPLDPPTAGGLPYDEAQRIAAAWWADDPHLAAALMWESYAATLDPTLAVSMVNTGAQSVSYGTARPGGEYGLAVARAEWHRSFTTAVSVPLRVRLCPWSGRAATAGARSTRDRDRVVPGAPQAAVLVVAAAASGLAAHPRRAARRVPVVRRVRGARDRRASCARAGGRGRPGQPDVALRRVPPPRHRDRGRVAVGAVISGARTASGACGVRMHAMTAPHAPSSPAGSENGKTWVRASGAGRYPLQATTLRGTPHPPLAARRPALAAVRCQAGRGRVHRCAGGPRRPDPPAALSGPRSAPPPWRRCWTTRSGGPCGCRVTRCRGSYRAGRRVPCS